jgi:hypothetical protein
VNIDRPEYDAIWQCVGMFVLVYAPAYYWVARRPARHPQLVLIGLLGKVFGPIGFVFAATSGDLPASFGWTLITNDAVWWVPFGLYLRDAASRCGGWGAILRGD